MIMSLTFKTMKVKPNKVKDLSRGRSGEGCGGNILFGLKFMRLQHSLLQLQLQLQLELHQQLVQLATQRVARLAVLSVIGSVQD